MTCKVVGFSGKVGKSERKVDNGKVTVRTKTAAELASDPLFVSACLQLAERYDKNLEVFTTKRQASKFFRNEGIVYQETLGKAANITKRQADIGKEVIDES